MIEVREVIEVGEIESGLEITIKIVGTVITTGRRTVGEIRIAIEIEIVITITAEGAVVARRIRWV